MIKLQIGFSKPKKCFPVYSWAIRALYHTKYSHVFVRWYSLGAQADIVYEASGTSVKFVAGRLFDQKATTLHTYEIEIDRDAYRALLHYCMTNAGIDYGALQAIGIGFAKLLKLKQNPFSNGTSKQVCSELVASILKNVNNVTLPIDLDMASPKDIKQILDNNSQFTKVL